MVKKLAKSDHYFLIIYCSLISLLFVKQWAVSPENFIVWGWNFQGSLVKNNYIYDKKLAKSDHYFLIFYCSLIILLFVKQWVVSPENYIVWSWNFQGGPEMISVTHMQNFGITTLIFFILEGGWNPPPPGLFKTQNSLG